MRLTIAASLLACVASAHAFKNTSPYLLFSSSEHATDSALSSNEQLQLGKDVLHNTKLLLSECPSDEYVIIQQPGVTAADFTGRKSPAVLLKKAYGKEQVKTKRNVPEVVGDVDAADLAAYIARNCHAVVQDEEPEHGYGDMPDGQARVIRLNFPAVPATGPERTLMLQDHDASLQSIFSLVESKKYTIIYITQPPSDLHMPHSFYEAIFAEPLHTEMKRDANGYIARAAENSTVPSNAPLFEKYAFLSPGLFMGLFVTLILLSILAVGMNAISSLQVSYGAFEKEMGPNAQKKAQ